MKPSSSSSNRGGPLSCPRCAVSHSIDERFCPDCGMPLVYSGAREMEPITEKHERARKIDPRYTQGKLVRVATGRNEPEGEMIQGILLEEGIPSILQRTRGFDVADFIAAGPRDVMVPASGAEAATEVLTPAGATGPPGPMVPDSWSAPVLLAVIAGSFAVIALIVWLLSATA